MKASPFGHLKKGALHKQLGYKSGEKIPLAALETASRSSNALLRKRAQFALNARKFHHVAVGLIGLIGLMTAGCTVVSNDRVFPKLAWYWSAEAKGQRETDAREKANMRNYQPYSPPTSAPSVWTNLPPGF